MSNKKIKIHLIPVKQWHQNCRYLLKKSEWDLIRREVYRNAGYECSACGAKDTELHAHEVWDFGMRYTPIMGILPWFRKTQKLVDIVCLCKECHSATHLGFGDANDGLDDRIAAEERLMKVNKWNRLQLHFAIKEAYRRVKALNDTEWYVDIEYAKRMLLDD